MIETETYSFGGWLKQQRERLRLTQRELAATVHCSVATIKKIEADERHPSPELARLLAVELQIPGPNQTIFVEAARGERPVDGLWHVHPGPGYLEPGDDAATSSFPSPAPIPFPPLPRPATSLVGRADELKAIAERLADPDGNYFQLMSPMEG